MKQKHITGVVICRRQNYLLSKKSPKSSITTAAGNVSSRWKAAKYFLISSSSFTYFICMRWKTSEDGSIPWERKGGLESNLWRLQMKRTFGLEELAAAATLNAYWKSREVFPEEGGPERRSRLELECCWSRFRWLLPLQKNVSTITFTLLFFSHYQLY